MNNSPFVNDPFNWRSLTSSKHLFKRNASELIELRVTHRFRKLVHHLVRFCDPTLAGGATITLNFGIGADLLWFYIFGGDKGTTGRTTVAYLLSGGLGIYANVIAAPCY